MAKDGLDWIRIYPIGHSFEMPNGAVPATVGVSRRALL